MREAQFLTSGYHWFIFSEADTSTAVVQAANMSVIKSAPTLRSAENAEDDFKSRAGDDGQLDAYELQDILNNTFVKSKSQ